MARKKTSEIQSVAADEISNKQVRLPNDLIRMVEEIVGAKKGAVGSYIAAILRPIVTERHREWLIARIKGHGIAVRE